MEEGATGQGMRQPVEPGKAKEMDSPLEPPERNRPANTDFSPLKLISDFWPSVSTVRI